MRHLNPETIARVRDELAANRGGPWYREGKWSISPHNFALDVQAQLSSVPAKVIISDLTPRIIEHMPGRQLTFAQRIDLITALAEMGVAQVHPRTWAHKEPYVSEIREIANRGIPIETVSVVHRREQATLLAAAGIDILEVATFPRPAMQLAVTESRPATSLEQHLHQVGTELTYVKTLGVKVKANFTDVGFADPDWILAVAKLAASIGVDWIQIADSSSSLGPHAVAWLAQKLRGAAPGVPLAAHIHNDFGLATATALAALDAGVELFDTSVDGIGEKGGQLNLGTFALTCEAFYAGHTASAIDLTRLGQISHLVQQVSDTTVSEYAPLSGNGAFCSTMEHNRMLQECVDPFVASSLAPAAVGASKAYDLGVFSGPYGLMQEARRLGIVLDDDALDSAHAALIAWFESKRRRVTDQELLELIGNPNSARRGA